VLGTEDKTFWQLKNYDRHAAAVHAVFGIVLSRSRTFVREVLTSLWAHCVPVEWYFGVTCAGVHNVPLKGQVFWNVHYPLCTLGLSRTSHIGVSVLKFASFAVTDALTRMVLIVREDDANLSVEICKTVIG
jgi:hypothetical protein